jgi:thiol-disulfide isomerase/thioredoxin
LELSLRLVILGLLGSSALVLGACDRQSGPAPQPDAEITSAPGEEPAGKLDISQRGKGMPAVAFEGPAGEKVRLADFKGKPLLVNLWATWCGPCIAEMPTLDALAEREGGRLRVLVVSQDIARDKVDAWWARQKLPQLQPYLDRNSDLGFAFATGVVPTTILYDADGKEVWRVIGGMDWNGPRANTLLAETLGKTG